MPKEQGNPGERVARCSSKTAKDKSNSATLQASQGGGRREQSGMGDKNSRVRHFHSEKDSEKDSGYSETGSDTVNADLDEQQSLRNSNNNSSSGGLIATGLNTPSYEELPPIYVIKNLVVKPSRSEQLLHSSLAWGGSWHSLTNAKSPTQLLLIQQPTISSPSPSTPAPSGQNTLQGQAKKGGSRCRQNHSGGRNSYLPILNSYPRIAPHPRKDNHEIKPPSQRGNEGHSQSKRVCMEEEKQEAVSTTSHLLKPKQHQQKDGKNRGGHGTFPSSTHRCQQSSGSDSVSSSSVSSSQTPLSPPSSFHSPSSQSPHSSSSSSSTAQRPYGSAPDSSSTRHRRFLNTAEILNQSGLLAIALRTKELLKQNAATDREIAQLRQHTHLLCQIAQVGQKECKDGTQGMDQLVQTMSKSGGYPKLDLNQMNEPGRSAEQSNTVSEPDAGKEKNKNTTETQSNPPQVLSRHHIDDGTSPPSPLFAPSPSAE